jgi:hypothetical protein
MNADRFNKLKQKMSKESDLSKIWHYYMDHFSDHPEFIDMGAPEQNPFVEGAIREIFKQFFGKKVPSVNLLLIHIPEYNFFHGPLQCQGRIGGVIYSDDIKIGLIAMSSSSSDEVKYSRFSSPINISYGEGDRN